MPVKRAAGFLMVRTKGKAFLLSWGFVAGKISYYLFSYRHRQKVGNPGRHLPLSKVQFIV